MSRVEAFVTRIKIESSDQSPFLRADQGIKVTSKLQKSKDQERVAPIWPFSRQKKFEQSRGFEGTIKQSSTLFADQKSWSRSQMLQQATVTTLAPLNIACVQETVNNIYLYLYETWTHTEYGHIYLAGPPHVDPEVAPTNQMSRQTKAQVALQGRGRARSQPHHPAMKRREKWQNQVSTSLTFVREVMTYLLSLLIASWRRWGSRPKIEEWGDRSIVLWNPPSTHTHKTN